MRGAFREVSKVCHSRINGKSGWWNEDRMKHLEFAKLVNEKLAGELDSAESLNVTEIWLKIEQKIKEIAVDMFRKAKTTAETDKEMKKVCKEKKAGQREGSNWRWNWLRHSRSTIREECGGATDCWLALTGLAPKKRKYRNADMENPSTAEWTAQVDSGVWFS